MGLISFIAGSDNRKHIKKLDALANKVEKYEAEYRNLTDEDNIHFIGFEGTHEFIKEDEPIQEFINDLFNYTIFFSYSQ